MTVVNVGLGRFGGGFAAACARRPSRQVATEIAAKMALSGGDR
ncbi:hypothetical protein [Rhodococcoides fascians]|nr:hypothetical protein [Rhodococcus fascians]